MSVEMRSDTNVDAGLAASIRDAYENFIAAKAVAAPVRGFAPPVPVAEMLYPFQRDTVAWALRLGCAAIFAKFGLGKSLMQLELGRQVCAFEGAAARFLVVAPLGVVDEFMTDAGKLGVGLTFVQDTAAGDALPPGLYVTNYESVREGKVDLGLFRGATLDEADCLRGMGATKTFREAMRQFEDARVPFRFVATATPSPNDYEELLAYAAFLGVMDVGQARTRFFKRDSEKADNLTLHPHKVAEFWRWVSSWALFITKPSDVDPSYDDGAHVLPELRMHWHELPTACADAGEERDGQRRLVPDSAIGVTAASREKRASVARRVAKAREIVAALRGPDGALTDQPIVWCERNDEQDAVEAMLAAEGVTAASLRGTQKRDERRDLIRAGVNLQQSHTEIFLGIDYKFRAFLQGIHRIHRFQQRHACDVHVLYTDAEREIRRALEAKWARHDELVAQMTALVREYGLGRDAMREHTTRASTVERRFASGERWTVVNNDTVRETAALESDLVDLIISSIPFGNQYEYSESFLDFGHTDDAAHFWAQMDFLTPELRRVLKPGRVAAIHVKDRIVPGGINGLGFQTVYAFHADCIAHFQRHGFAFMGMVTVATDVVRENAGTYRLAYTEQCKDGTRQGVGMPEYVLLFRKPQTDATRGYADEPVVKEKAAYTLARWQLDAAGVQRSDGNRLVTSEAMRHLTHDQMYKAWKRSSLAHGYDYEAHVALNQSLEDRGALPTDFSLLPAHVDPEAHPDVWTDVARMRTLNTTQAQQNRESHVCPLQFDIVDRIIRRFSMAGELVFDPFSGLGTVVRQAVLMKRRGRGHELNARYWADSVRYCRAAEREVATPTLFDLDAPPAAPATGDAE